LRISRNLWWRPRLSPDRGDEAIPDFRRLAALSEAAPKPIVCSRLHVDPIDERCPILLEKRTESAFADHVKQILGHGGDEVEEERPRPLGIGV